MAQRIHQLPPNLINKIAAGEVIVRPASAVKELIENSLDAGARRIRIEISNHCRDITVIDDGCGMLAEDAELALKRHTTSKIETYKDIENLMTRGFRGEALASIAAVSRMEIITHNEEEPAGCRLKVEAGTVLHREQVGAPIGTMVKVRDLFFNTPARLKFLGTPRTEFNHIIRIFVRQALSSPETGFTLITDKKTFADLPPGQSLEERVIQLLGASLVDSLLPVQFTQPPLSVFGLVARPEHTRKDRAQEYFFVNRRPITSRMLYAALEQAFKGYLMTKRFPIAVVFIDIEPGEVDVNVHPTKEEVRFTREYLVGGAVHRAVAEALQSANLTPGLKMPGTEGIATPEKGKPKAEQVRAEKPISFFSRQMEIIRKEADERQRARQKIIQLVSTEKSGSIKTKETSPVVVEKKEADELKVSPIPDEAKDSLWQDENIQPKVLGQVADTYIVVEYGDGLLLIDQHAAHERLIYEQLRRRFSDNIMTQQLMVPVEIEVGIGDVALMEKLCQVLQRYGIDVEPFGSDTYVVRSLPVDIAEQVDVEGLIFDLLDDLRRVGAGVSIEEFREKVLTRMACRSAIKSGQKLHPEEQQRLLDDIHRARLGFTCPHGRPTMIFISRGQLDKQFKRK